MDDVLTPREHRLLPATPVLDPDPMLPRRFRIVRVQRELSDTFTLHLTALDGGEMGFAPGQFNMLYIYPAGEVPISISGDPAVPSVLVHTTRVVGTVTEAMGSLKQGDVIGVRGPFGRPWPVQEAYGQDIVFVAGGLGLAPLRPAIYQVMAERKKFGNVVMLYGARTPDDILYRRLLQEWGGRFDVSVQVTVDRATHHWAGKVGVVTKLIKGGGFDRHNSVAFVCGPEIMMRFAVQTLNERGVTSDRIHVSMERNMKCAIGFCGHCQYGPHFVCKDGPVFRYDDVEDIFTVGGI